MSECNHNCSECTQNCSSRQCDHNCDDCELECESRNECTHDCSSCSANCSSRQYNREDFLIKTNQYSNVKKVIGIVSGKGGVGKSLVTSSLAVAMNQLGYNVGILDADITGPSIPQAFGLTGSLYATEDAIIPAETVNGIKVVSTNLILENATDPVVWRGPIIAGMVKQFYSDVNWGDIDYMFVDLPPGTGDVPLTVFQSLPLDGIIVVTTPQQLVGMIVEKAINMAGMMQIPVIGVIENMSYIKCDQCGHEVPIFGKKNTEAMSDKLQLNLLAKLPLDPYLASAVDEGLIENYPVEGLDKAIEAIKSL